VNPCSCAPFGPALFVMACNSVLGIEPGSFLGDAGAGGVSQQSSRDAGSGMDQMTRDARATAGHGGEAGSAYEPPAGTSPSAPGGAGNAIGTGGGGNVAAGGGVFGGGAGNAAECSAGQTRCVASTLQTCGQDARWSEEACHHACVPKQDGSNGFECGGSCRPGTTWCDGVTVLGSCDDVGTQHVSSCAERSGNACIELRAGSGVHGCSGECIPGRLQCSENTVQSCTPRGTWEEQTTCVGQTCIESEGSASCEGECAPDQLQCDDQGAPQQCIAGRWVPADACSSSEEDFEVCREGHCELADHFVGPGEPYDGTVDVQEDAVVVCRLPRLEHDAILMNFNVIGAPGAAQGGGARMVLYRDDGSSRVPSGEPVAQTGGQAFALLPQVVTIGTSETEVELDANTIYWVGIVTSQETSVRGQSGSLGTGLCRTWVLDFGAPFGSAQTGILQENTDVNLFLEVRDIE
jgi:hypothetical protein